MEILASFYILIIPFWPSWGIGIKWLPLLLLSWFELEDIFESSRGGLWRVGGLRSDDWGLRTENRGLRIEVWGLMSQVLYALKFGDVSRQVGGLGCSISDTYMEFGLV